MDMASGNLGRTPSLEFPTNSNITNAISAANNMQGKETISMTLSTSLDAMFKRKRGRPPKNRVVEVTYFSCNRLYVDSKLSRTIQLARIDMKNQSI